jgi:hypothetical protein
MGKKENIVGNVASLCCQSCRRARIRISRGRGPCISLISMVKRVVDLESIGKVPDAGSVAVGVTYDDDFMAAIN